LSNKFTIDICPVCQGSSFQKYLDVPDWLVSKQSFEVKECTSCTFRFTANAPSQEEIGPFYDSEEYVEHSDTQKGLIYSLYHYARKYMLNYKYRKIQKLSTGKKLLDIGSGSGYFAGFMQTKGYDVSGVEISEKAKNLCEEKFGIAAKSPGQFLNGELGGGYNLISLWHVLEHVYTLDEYFELFSQSLAENGHLIIALPNSNSTDAKMYQEYWAAFDVPRHLWHFTPSTFEKLANNKGFDVIKKHRLPLDVFFISMVSASYKKSFTFLPVTLVKACVGYLSSLLDPNNASSLIYVLKKR